MRRSCFGAFVVVAAMALLCMLAGKSGAAAGDTSRVSVATDGTQANGRSHSTPSISADGRFVAFDSAASNPVANDTNNVTDVFVRDRRTGTTERVSVSSDGTQANDGTSITSYFALEESSISADGRFVAFRSLASNLAANDSEDTWDIFLRDRDTDANGVFDEAGASSTQWLSRGGDSSINADGRYVAFLSTASDLVAGDTNGVTDVFVHERYPSSTQPPDSIDPITTRTLSPQPNAAGWNNSDVTVTLNATDTGGSGLKETAYSINGGASTTVQQNSVQIPVASEGTTTISYHSTDNAGNVEPEQTLTVKIDKSAPRVSTATPPGKGVARSTNAVATFSEVVDRASISASTFQLLKCSSTTATDCPTRITNVAITLSTDGLSATLNPFGSSTTRLAKNTKYKVVLTTGVTDEAGNHLDQNTTTSGNQKKVWYFTTGLT